MVSSKKFVPIADEAKTIKRVGYLAKVPDLFFWLSTLSISR